MKDLDSNDRRARGAPRRRRATGDTADTIGRRPVAWICDMARLIVRSLAQVLKVGRPTGSRRLPGP
jgi:hypothetical protein